MKRTKLLVLLALFSLCACERVPVGEVGILVDNYGGDKGVEDKVLPPGMYWVGMSKTLYTFPTFMQNYVWSASAHEGAAHDESISFQTKEGLTVNADVGISYRLDPEKVPVLFQTYRKGIEEITNVYVRNIVRNALVQEASTKPIEMVYGTGKADLLKTVQSDLRGKLQPVGIIVDQLSWAGNFRLPENVTTSINAKIQATQIAQQKENEVAAAKADAQKKVAEADGDAQSIFLRAQAQAKSNKILSESLTPEFVKYQAIVKWDGVLPKMSGNATPLINMGEITEAK